MNSKIKIKSDESRLRPDKSEVNRLLGDNTLLKELTNWQPSYSGLEGLKKGLNLTIEWFSKKENLSYYRPDQYSV